MSLAMLCLQPYLCLGAHTAYCRRVETTVEPATLFTWVPAQAEIVLLIRAHGYTLMYAPSTDTVYYTRPEIALLCADMTVMAAQFFVERGMPRLLVFDLLCDGGRDQAGTEAAARHRRLQVMQPLMKGPLTVQWCGEQAALNAEFLTQLPHQTAGLLAITDKPLVFSTTGRPLPLPTVVAAALQEEEPSCDERKTRRRTS